MVSAALILLARLKAVRVVAYEKLREHLGKKVRGSDALFLPALNLLFLLGTVQYLPKIDSFEYTGA